MHKTKPVFSIKINGEIKVNHEPLEGLFYDGKLLSYQVREDDGKTLTHRRHDIGEADAVIISQYLHKANESEE